ncbi:MAG: amidophosphoribosyltransferase [Bryobacteraceae bacterium]|nr:amidophosphoribosyltransferase [Bryobacteraceae bacterium]
MPEEELPFDKLHEECGVFAVYGHPEAANLAHLGLHALQHRGQESAGIASSDGKLIYTHKSMGHVADIFTASVLNGLPGYMAIGHTRYSTAGDSSVLNAQPFSVSCNKGRIAVAHNGNITNALELRAELEDHGAIFQASSDSEVILHLVAHSNQRTLAEALREALMLVEGAFSLVVIAGDSVIVARDPHGFRPLAIGRMNTTKGPVYVFASETCAFDLIDAHYIGDVEPGEMVIAGPNGLTREFYTLPDKPAQCVFEHVYFSRPDSIVFGVAVQQSRELMGRFLSEELPVQADVVVPIPDSGVAAALGYSHASGIPFAHGLIRNHYVGRTFIEPSQAIRDFGVRLKLNPVREILAGKSVILVDDSLVRGTTSQKIVRMVRNAGAKEVHLRISCPPTISPCFYGVDTPTKRELIAANQSVEEIRHFIDCDTLAYLSIEKLAMAVRDTGNERQFCYACYTGKYPTELVNIGELMTSRPNRC